MDGLFEGLSGTATLVKPAPKKIILATREQWLNKAAEKMHSWLHEAGAGPRPRYRLSVGWPFGGRKVPKKDGGSHRIGECFAGSASADGTSEIFISPILDEPNLVLATLLHELVHAYVGVKAKHGPLFRKVAVAAGLEGKMTATVAGAILVPKLTSLAASIGEFPHRKLTVGENPLKPKQGTRMLKILCPSCGWAARTTQKWLDVGLPTCVCGVEMTSEDSEDEGDE